MQKEREREEEQGQAQQRRLAMVDVDVARLSDREVALQVCSIPYPAGYDRGACIIIRPWHRSVPVALLAGALFTCGRASVCVVRGRGGVLLVCLLWLWLWLRLRLLLCA
eukprot:COSAG05_NODE_1282_length_5283_cov_4.584684_1_plen_108_part_10